MAESASAAEDETQIVADPVIVPASADGFTVTTFVAITVPQLLATVYDIVAVPAATPVTIPVKDPIVAIPIAPELHIPPVAALVNVVEADPHSVPVPVMVPASGILLTVTTVVAATVPQPLLTV
jgi:hypothetical protein